MVGDGGAQDPGDDRQGLAEPRRQQDRQQLGLVPDLGEGDHQGRYEQRLHAASQQG